MARALYETRAVCAARVVREARAVGAVRAACVAQFFFYFKPKVLLAIAFATPKVAHAREFLGSNRSVLCTRCQNGSEKTTKEAFARTIDIEPRLSMSQII